MRLALVPLLGRFYVPGLIRGGGTEPDDEDLALRVGAWCAVICANCG
jgi:hypothetical protein